MRLKSIFLWLVMVLVLPGAAGAEALKLSMLPNLAPDVIHREAKSLAEYLSQKTGLRFETDLAADFSQYEKRLNAGSVAVGYENPFVYTRVSDAHEAVVMAVTEEGKDRYRGVIITMENSGIMSLEDLRGKRVCIVGFTSACGFLSQKLSLKNAGIDAERELTLVEAVDNKAENVILEVFMGDADAGFVHESALKEARKYISTANIRLVQACAWLPNWAVSVDKNLPLPVKKAVQAALLDIPAGHPVLAALGIKSFRYALDEDYDPIRQAAE